MFTCISIFWYQSEFANITVSIVSCKSHNTIARLTQYSDSQNLDYHPLEYDYEYGICCMWTSTERRTLCMHRKLCQVFMKERSVTVLIKLLKSKTEKRAKTDGSTLNLKHACVDCHSYSTHVYRNNSDVCIDINIMFGIWLQFEYRDCMEFVVLVNKENINIEGNKKHMNCTDDK